MRKVLAFIFLLLSCFVLKTWLDFSAVDPALSSLQSFIKNSQLTDRNGKPLSISYQNRWNIYDAVSLAQMPQLLVESFVFSEDKRFYSHSGVDWRARGSALWQNLRYRRVVRGASTITEQVVRMANPRPRTFWSKWLEGLEAIRLESQYSKAEILEFYLNQLPYAANRRGVVQAARYYFDRDLSTLNAKEILTLVVLARAPSRFDLFMQGQGAPDQRRYFSQAVERLAQGLGGAGLLREAQLARVSEQEIVLAEKRGFIDASHFVAFVRRQSAEELGSGRLRRRTTLDLSLQREVQLLLDERMEALFKKAVLNASVLVVDHATSEILAWVVAGVNQLGHFGGKFDAVLTARQPGSALKPFLYALALESGWSAATIIEDAPLADAVGTGLHSFRNYSRQYYGKVSLREALGNSLNVPAVQAIRRVGSARYLAVLHSLGFSSLNRGVGVYDEGLALGSGEVSLLELVRAYAVLANRGVARPLQFLMESPGGEGARRIFSEESSSLIGHILSDPAARRFEFGRDSILNLPLQTAVKTGTSTDYRDAWALGYNDRFVVGVWMGNLNNAPMDGVTGSTGPALVLRAIFAHLNQHRQTAPLFLSAKLAERDICLEYAEDAPCFQRSEYFLRDQESPAVQARGEFREIELVRPTNGLQIALDPRIPRERQKFEFSVKGLEPGEGVEWVLNDTPIARSEGGQYLWPLQRGSFRLKAEVRDNFGGVAQVREVDFVVK